MGRTETGEQGICGEMGAAVLKGSEITMTDIMAQRSHFT